MAYYAHSLKNQPEQAWEPLVRHLTEVQDNAGQRGARFGAETLAAVAGILHDLGKYGPDFQARIRGSGQSADHSTAGAVWARQNLPPPWCQILAHVVAGHHTGLKDGVFDSEGRLDSKAGLLTAVLQSAAADGLALPKTVAGPQGFKRLPHEWGFQLAFLTRMIFSSLIDADRMAAAAFDAGENRIDAVSHPTIVDLETTLQGWMNQREAVAKPLNTIRAEVLQAAIDKAREPPGMFSLTVPTGGGKTLTSLAFALAHARVHGLERVIVVIPFTSIIEQTAQVYRGALAPFGDSVLEHHSAFEMTDESKWSGARIGPDRLKLAMERWDSPIVVTTAVQFFESLFADRTSRCRKLHSLARSVIVVDEAQTMPLPLLRPCVAALKELARNYDSSVVLCTATQPSLTAPDGAPADDWRFKRVRELAPDYFAALRRVTVRDIGVQTDADISGLMAGREQALCIVNQRAHARALFHAVRHLPGVRHLSTCMHSVHRTRVLAEIREDLKANRPCRVVATSLIEAGVDVDFPLVLRASAGLDQIAQAAGRCNREFKHTQEASEVLVFTAAEYGVIPQLRANAEAGAEMLTVHKDDPFAPAALKAYFDLLYAKITDAALDRSGVMALCADKAADLNFPFETIAREMRFIDDTMVPVIVAREEAVPGEVRALLDRLPFALGVGGIARQLARYTVGVPRRVRGQLIAAKLAELIDEDRFGDQFVVLHNLELYTPAIGLDWSDITFRAAETLMMV